MDTRQLSMRRPGCGWQYESPPGPQRVGRWELAGSAELLWTHRLPGLSCTVSPGGRAHKGPSLQSWPTIPLQCCSVVKCGLGHRRAGPPRDMGWCERRWSALHSEPSHIRHPAGVLGARAKAQQGGSFLPPAEASQPGPRPGGLQAVWQSGVF